MSLLNCIDLYNKYQTFLIFMQNSFWTESIVVVFPLSATWGRQIYIFCTITNYSKIIKRHSIILFLCGNRAVIIEEKYIKSLPGRAQDSWVAFTITAPFNIGLPENVGNIVCVSETCLESLFPVDSLFSSQMMNGFDETDTSSSFLRAREQLRPLRFFYAV